MQVFKFEDYEKGFLTSNGVLLRDVSNKADGYVCAKPDLDYVMYPVFTARDGSKVRIYVVRDEFTGIIDALFIVSILLDDAEYCATCSHTLNERSHKMVVGARFDYCEICKTACA